MEDDRLGGGPLIQRGVAPPMRWWRVGPDRVEMIPAGKGWSARVVRADWCGAALDIDGHFGDEAEALAWCERMASVLTEDLDDEGEPGNQPAPITPDL